MTEEGAETKITKMANVLPICLAVFFNDMGSDMLFALYSLFFVQVLRVQDTILGLVDSLALLFRFVIMPFVVGGRFYLLCAAFVALLIPASVRAVESA